MDDSLLALVITAYARSTVCGDVIAAHLKKWTNDKLAEHLENSRRACSDGTFSDELTPEQRTAREIAKQISMSFLRWFKSPPYNPCDTLQSIGTPGTRFLHMWEKTTPDVRTWCSDNSKDMHDAGGQDAYVEKVFAGCVAGVRESVQLALQFEARSEGDYSRIVGSSAEKGSYSVYLAAAVDKYDSELFCHDCGALTVDKESFGVCKLCTGGTTDEGSAHGGAGRS